jgi:hypothetical protein
MLRLAGIITAIGISTFVPADASTIFSETFDNLTPGAQLVALPFSQRAAGTYTLINSLPGWSAVGMASGVYAFEYGSANYAVLLNEGGHSISQNITGLTIGQAYDLQFQYWGDNVAAAYTFNVTINGTTSSFNAMGVSAPTGGYYTVDIPFVATGTGTTLTFQETSATTASPIFDNILITDSDPDNILITYSDPGAVPEPATALLVGCAIGLVATARRQVTR